MPTGVRGTSAIKARPLANDCPRDVEQLHAHVAIATAAVSGQQRLLRSFVRATRLPIRLPHAR